MAYEIEEPVSCTVGLAELARACSPFDGEQWDCDPIDPTEVLAAARAGVTEREAWDSANERTRGPGSAFDHRGFHVRRMAHMLSRPEDAQGALALAFEGYVDRLGRDTRRVFLLEGNHRLGAAMLRDASLPGDVEVVVEAAEFEDICRLLPSLARAPGATPSP